MQGVSSRKFCVYHANKASVSFDARKEQIELSVLSAYNPVQNLDIYLVC